MKKTLEHLETLAEAARAYWESSDCADDQAEDYFETELVRAEDYLEEVKRDANI
jgi:hypothetical protein